MFPSVQIRICVLYTSKLTYVWTPERQQSYNHTCNLLLDQTSVKCLRCTMERKKAAGNYDSRKKVNRDTKKGPWPHFDDNDLTTLCLAIIFNQPEILKDVARVKKKEINDIGVVINQDEVELYHVSQRIQEA
jgi:hypothetical protein